VEWSARRQTLATTSVGAGGLLGAALGWWAGWPLGGAVLGGVAAASIVVWADDRHAAAVLGWLQSGSRERRTDPLGLWGESLHRIDRELSVGRRHAEAQRPSGFLAAIEASPNGVMLLDEMLRITWCNRTAAEQFELDPQRDLGQAVTKLVRSPAFVTYVQGPAHERPVHVPATRGRGVISVLLWRYGQGMRQRLSQEITEREAAQHMRRDLGANVSDDHEMTP